MWTAADDDTASNHSCGSCISGPAAPAQQAAAAAEQVAASAAKAAASAEAAAGAAHKAAGAAAAVEAAAAARATAEAEAAAAHREQLAAAAAAASAAAGAATAAATAAAASATEAAAAVTAAAEVLQQIQQQQQHQENQQVEQQAAAETEAAAAAAVAADEEAAAAAESAAEGQQKDTKVEPLPSNWVRQYCETEEAWSYHRLPAGTCPVTWNRPPASAWEVWLTDEGEWFFRDDPLNITTWNRPPFPDCPGTERYAMLGVSSDASVKTIVNAARNIIARDKTIHPDKGGTAEAPHLLNNVQRGGYLMYMCSR